MRLPAPLTVIAASEHIDALTADRDAPWLEDVALIPLGLHDTIASTHLAGAGILVVQIDPAVPASMRRIERVRKLRSDLPQVVALESANVGLVRTLLREGVADVVSLPLSFEELLQAAVTVMESRAPQPDARDTLAPLVAVARTPGSSGATTLATHLGARLAREGTGVCLFDLDIQTGRAAEVLGLRPRRCLTDLLDAGVRIDQAMLQSVVEQHSSGLALVAAPQDIGPLEAIDSEQLHKAVELARKAYDYVLMDLPTGLTNWSLTMLAEANAIVMIVEQNLASLRQARRRLDLMRSVGIDRKHISIVVNRVERRLFGSIGLADVEEALGHDVLCAIHADAQNLGIAQDQGLLVHEVRSKSPYSADVDKLADALRIKFGKLS
ncbi:pilus assembly protein CpaE [Sphingopyxis flava]|uniref:Pilus assembly protein CpaE n=1 Tax=Sphingopyxis flava TaxID=1507287 RepID=A0A1T5EVT5_9SPHN|nr:pilus assembly protein CpaE [Sphingopyxis flava]